MGRVIGYVCVKTDEQNLDLQLLAIEKYTKEHDMELILYVEKVSTRKAERTELQKYSYLIYKLNKHNPVLT